MSRPAVPIARGDQLSTPPDVAAWRDLYEAARLFREQSPWKVLLDEQLFAVEMPQTAETLFCSVLGAEGVQFGLNAAIGARGLYGYVMLLAGELDEDEMALEQRCLSFLLGSRHEVSADDRKIQAELGLKFRARTPGRYS